MENNEIRIHPLLNAKELKLIADMLLTKKCEITYKALHEEYEISEINIKDMADKLLHTLIIQYSDKAISKMQIFTRFIRDDNSIKFLFHKEIENMGEPLIHFCLNSHYAIFDAHGADSELNSRSGSKVEVLRDLTEAECDIDEVGRMYHIRFADGFETDAFEDELYNTI